MLKYLRIAVTAMSLTACVLLIALWVRSYWRFDQVIHRASATDYWVAVTSARGQVAFGGGNEPILSTIFKQDWVHRGFAMKGVDNESGSPIPVFPVDLPNSAILLWPHFKSPFLVDQSTSYELRVPYWLLVLTSAAFAASPWLLGHFSLRTLLIAMTLVAVAMGVFAVSS